MRIAFVLSIFLLSWKLPAAELRNSIVIFNSAEEALPYVFKAPWNYVNSALAPTSYEKVEKTLDEVFNPLCQKFPNCKDFPRPIVMLTNNGDSASFGLIFDQRRRQSNVLLVSEELAFNRKHLEFVVTHELVHYFSRHAETEGAELEISDIYKSYKGVKEAFEYPFDEVKYDFLNLRKLMNELGPRAHLISSIHGFSVNGTLGSLIQSMLAEVGKYGSQCMRLGLQFKRIKSIQASGKFISSLNGEVLKFLKTSKLCFEKYPGNLIQDVSKKEGIFTDVQDDIKALVEIDSGELRRIQEIHRLKMRAYTSLSQKLGGPQIRFENEEDIADLIALEFLLSLGRKEMRQFTDYLLTDAIPRDQLKCFSDLNENKEPFYGVLTNSHHEECWRIWRAQQVESNFKKNQE